MCSSSVRPDGAPAAIERPVTARVFFALWPAAAAAGPLAEIARSAASRFGGKPTRQATLHLTLAFLGQVPESRLPSLIAAAAEVRSPSFALNIDRLGYWPDKHLLWAGCRASDPALGQLVHRLRSALLEAGFAVDARPAFTPHVTLVRKMPGVNFLPDFQAGWPCNGFVLVRSSLSAGGPEYHVLAEFPLEPTPP